MLKIWQLIVIVEILTDFMLGFELGLPLKHFGEFPQSCGERTGILELVVGIWFPSSSTI